MKLFRQDVELFKQEPGIVGMLKQIERAGRVCYKSEGRITEDSYDKFINNVILANGHWAVLEFGTVYLTVPKSTEWSDPKDFSFARNYFGHRNLQDDVDIDTLNELTRGTKFVVEKDDMYITTNYRVIHKLNDYLGEDFDVLAFMEKYWTEPTKFHKLRINTHWICSRATANQVIRHRDMSVAQESQRYCNYSAISKFEDGVGFVVPQWIYKFLPKHREFIPKPQGENDILVWELLKYKEPVVALREKNWINTEQEYRLEMKLGLLPEEARGVLDNDVKTEFCFCGYIEDFMYQPPENSKEKAGFFTLRTAKEAQSDVRHLAIKLESLIRDNYDCN